MSERKFTRLKQSLSQTTGTAAKARETVSRELRQSTLSPGTESFLNAIDTDYERSLREWNAELKQKLRDAWEESRVQCSSNDVNNDETLQPSSGTSAAEASMAPERIDLDLFTHYATPDDDIQCLTENGIDAQQQQQQSSPSSSHHSNQHHHVQHPHHHQPRFDFNRYYPSVSKTRPSSSFAYECIQQLTGSRHAIRWKMLEQYFGTVFDTALSRESFVDAHSTTLAYRLSNGCSSSGANNVTVAATTPTSSAASGNSCSMISNTNNVSNVVSNGVTGTDVAFSSRASSPLQGLKSHLFECDQQHQHESALTPLGFRISSQNRLIREGNASVISLENDLSSSPSQCSSSGTSNTTNSTSSSVRASSSNSSGWLTLSKDEKSCFLTFYDSPRRDKIRWHIEVNRRVSKLAEPPVKSSSRSEDLTKSCFRVTKHLIFTDKRYTDDWLKDINQNIGQEFAPEEELVRIMMGDNREISERMRSSALISEINLFASFANDLLARPGSFGRLKNSIHRIGFNGYLREVSPEYFRFQFNIRSFEVQTSSNERNKNAGAQWSGDTFFLRVSLFDSKLGKISEEFRYAVSSDLKMLRGDKVADQNRGYEQRLLCNASKAIFFVDLAQSQPSDLFLVIRVEKSLHRLSGFVCSQNIPSNSNNNYTQNDGLILQHSEPYAWSMRPVFQDHHSQSIPALETSCNFGVFFKMDHNRLSDDFIVQSLRSQQAAQSNSKSQTVLSARLDVELLDLRDTQQSGNSSGLNSGPPSASVSGKSTNPLQAKHQAHRSSESLLNNANQDTTSAPEVVLNSSLFVVGDGGSSGTSANFSPVIEIQPLRLLHLPHREYFNLLYIYPQSLKFDSQRAFSKARNLSVTIEIRDSDEPEKDSAKALPLIFGRSQDVSMFVTSATTSLTKHNVTPDFFEEIKVALPLQFSEKLHVLFTFAHVSCKKECTYSIVGYSWMRLAPDMPVRTRMENTIHSTNQSLNVFTSLPSGYLSCQTLGLGKGLNLPDIKAVGKELFKLTTVLMSSVVSRDVDIQEAVSSMIKITRSNRDDSKEISTIISLERNLPKQLRHLMDCDVNELTHFLPLILNQLLKLLVFAASQELITEAFKTILLMVEKFTIMERVKLLNAFIEETFKTSEFCGVYVHDQLVILLNKIFTDYAQNVGNSGSSSFGSGAFDELKLLLNSMWFVLRIMTKSMIQYLIQTGRALLAREDRFDAEFVGNVKQFIESISGLIATFSRAAEASAANQSIAHFMTRLCSFFDRSVVFNMFHHHISILSSRDIIIQELKLAAIAILLSHEHFAILSNPLLEVEVETLKNGGLFANCFSLDSEFSKKHFPVYLALTEFRQAYAGTLSTASCSGGNTTANKHVRQICLIMIRNQLAKHLLDDRWNPSNQKNQNCQEAKAHRERYREKLLALYLPIVQIILENTNRMIDSTIASKNGQYWSFGLVTMMLASSTLNSGGSNSKSTSPFSTVNEPPGLLQDSCSLSTLIQFSRSNSENAHNGTAQSISSVSSFGSLSSALSTLTLTNVGTGGHNRTNSIALSQSATSASASGRSDKFATEEVRDLFVCLLAVVQVLNIDRMNELGNKSLKDLFLCLECAVNVFEYKPQSKGNKSEQSISTSHSHGHHSNRSKTLPNFLEGSGDFFNGATLNSSSNSTHELMTNYIMQQNMSIQTALITLRTVHLYLDNDLKPIDTTIIAQILSIYLTLMSLPQSQTVLIHVFNSIRYFVQKFALLLFNSDAFLSPIIAKIVKYCNSSLTLIRQSATDLLYCLLSTNLKRTRFETIVCVSRLASSDQHGLLYLQSSLNRIELLASVDVKDLKNANNALEHGHDDEEVSILSIVIRIREILKATKQIREESSDPYLGSELRLQLANSYSKTSRSLLRTWMENLAEMHFQRGDWAEAAMCLCQVIAIMVGQLASKGVEIQDSMANLIKISENILAKDNFKQETDWLELEESHVSIEILENFIKKAVEWFEKAELFELSPNVLKVLISWYEKEYEHKKLSELYTKIAKVHSKVQEINESGKRLFDTFFRIAFYQANQFGGHRTEYIYKCTKVVSLAEMTGRMQALHPGAIFLSSDPESLMDVPALLKADADSCSKKIGIVITHVYPFVENARNQFEKCVGVSQFVYEQRLTGKIAHSVAEQFKKRVILTVPNAFPYFLKRIPVSNRREMILSPIEVAIDEMQDRVHQLDHVIGAKDAKHLQLILQGSVNVVVNAGPIAYANAFLRKPMDEPGSCLGDDRSKDVDTTDSASNNSCDMFSESQKHLKFLFEQFLDLCESALKLNERLIKANQTEYHQNLKVNFEKLRNELDFLNERHTSIQIFDVISGATFA